MQASYILKNKIDFLRVLTVVMLLLSLVGHDSFGQAISGHSTSGFGVDGFSFNSIGVNGFSNTSTGVFGFGKEGVIGEGLEVGVKGICVTGTGSYFRGKKTNEFADIVLGAEYGCPAPAGDNGVLASDPDCPDSDLYLRTNDALVIQLDADTSQTGRVLVKNDLQNDIFEIHENGDVIITGSLTVSGTIINNSSKGHHDQHSDIETLYEIIKKQDEQIKALKVKISELDRLETEINGLKALIASNNSR